MSSFFIQIYNWIEVWSLFIPLFVLFKNKTQPHYLKPIIIYLWFALPINLLGDLIWILKPYLDLPPWLRVNTYLYTIHSIVRFFLFSWFFLSLNKPLLRKLKKNLPFLFITGVVINFLFFEHFELYHYENGKPFGSISSHTFAIESGLLLIDCLLYFFNEMQEEYTGVSKRKPDFWIAIGLSIYVVFNFSLFVFYNSLLPQTKIIMWKFHNLTYLILCIFIAKAFNVSAEE